MNGLKSGAGDDLWEDDESEDEVAEGEDGIGEGEEEEAHEEEHHRSGGGDDAVEHEPDREPERKSDSAGNSSGQLSDVGQSVRGDGGQMSSGGTASERPYVVRRALQDKSIQFERDERLTFFVHQDVAEGERDLIREVESALGRDIPKFDVREAVYRAALRNQDAVLEELLRMGYTADDDG